MLYSESFTCSTSVTLQAAVVYECYVFLTHLFSSKINFRRYLCMPNILHKLEWVSLVDNIYCTERTKQDILPRLFYFTCLIYLAVTYTRSSPACVVYVRVSWLYVGMTIMVNRINYFKCHSRVLYTPMLLERAYYIQLLTVVGLKPIISGWGCLSTSNILLFGN